MKPGYETGQSAGPRNYTRVRVCFPCGCMCVCVCARSCLLSLYTKLQMRLVIYVYVGAGANAHPCVRMHIYVFKAWTGEVGPLCFSASRRSFLLVTPLVSRFLPPLASFHPSLPSQPLSFLSSLSLSLSFYDPRSALPPTRLVRTIGVSTLETLHAWHTCKRARKSTQYRYQ